MLCPYCQKEMDEGWLVYRDSLLWSKQQKNVGILPIGKDTICLRSESSSMFCSNRKAYHCHSCKKIIIDYR